MDRSTRRHLVAKELRQRLAGRRPDENTERLVSTGRRLPQKVDETGTDTKGAITHTIDSMNSSPPHSHKLVTN